MLDTLRRIETPEGAELTLRTAGVHGRAWAWVLDMLIRSVVYFVVLMFVSFLGDAGMGFMFITVFLLEWGYPVVFEVFSNGSTPGKKSLGIAVVHDDGTPVTFGSSLVRNLLRVIDFFPFFYVTGFVTMLLDQESRRIGDIVAGTVVVYVDQPGGRSRVPEVDPYPVMVSLGAEEQKAVVEFAERQGDWTEARAVELADNLEELTGTRGSQGLERLLGIARSIQEGR